MTPFDLKKDDDAAEVCENVSRKKACYNGQRCDHNEPDECVAITLSPHVSVQINTKAHSCYNFQSPCEAYTAIQKENAYTDKEVALLQSVPFYKGKQ